MARKRRRTRTRLESAEQHSNWNTASQSLTGFAQKYAAYQANKPKTKQQQQQLEFSYSFDFPFDDYQWQATRALADGKSVLVAAPTGAGKTVVGEFGVYLALANQSKAFYTTPIKALSNQKYRDLVDKYGSKQVGLLTGDVTINPQAPVVVMTTEVLRNMLYRGDDRLSNLGYVILDEVHYLADRFRGPVWEEVILNLAQSVQIIALSATVSNAEEFGSWLAKTRGKLEVIVWETRPVPLQQHMVVSGRLYPLYRGKRGDKQKLNPALLAAASHGQSRTPRARIPITSAREAILELNRHGLLPAIYFVFSRSGCDQARDQILASGIDLTTTEEKQEIRDLALAALSPFDGADWATFDLDQLVEGWCRGIATHHAGLLPILKEVVEQLFTSGLLKVVFATETLALGINMPARSVVIQSLRKWDGSDFQMLTAGQYTQLTGRAGRRGIDTEGHAVVLARNGVNPAMVSALASKRTYPLQSAFHPTYNMAVNLLESTSLSQAKSTLEHSFAQFQAERKEVSRWRDKAAEKRRVADRLLASGRFDCQLGDVLEYARLVGEDRRRHRNSWHTTNKKIPTSSRSQLIRTLSDFRRGDIVAVQAASDQILAYLVLEVLRPGIDHWENRRHSGPTVTVLTRQARIETLTVDNLNGPIKLAAQIHIPGELSERKPRDRQRIASKLRNILQLGVLDDLFEIPSESKPDWSDQPDQATRENSVLGADLANLTDAALSQLITTHPVHQCPQVNEHLGQTQRWLRLDRQADELELKAQQSAARLGDSFDAILAVLHHLEYIDDEGKVLPPGQILRSIYAESDLLLAQALRDGIFDGLDPVSLAGVVSATTYQARRETLSAPVPPALRPAVQRIKDLANQLRSVQEKVLTGEIEITGQIAIGGPVALRWGKKIARGGQAGFSEQMLDILGDLACGVDTSSDLVAGVVAWANGESLSQVLTLVDLEAGDFVRAIKQLVEVLRQIETLTSGELSINAHRARKLIHRGVVAWSEV